MLLGRGQPHVAAAAEGAVLAGGAAVVRRPGEGGERDRLALQGSHVTILSRPSQDICYVQRIHGNTWHTDCDL